MLNREAAPLRVRAVEHLRDQIVSGAYSPGDRLTERSLEAGLGVSRSVVREALRQLESERLIELRPNVGPVVRTLGHQEAVDLYEVRGALEGLAGGLAAGNATAAQVAVLRKVLKALQHSGSHPSLPDILALKNTFYATLVEASANPVIGELLGNVRARISQLRAVTLQQPGRTPVMVAELTRIVDAIEAGDADAAQGACRDHVRSASFLASEHLSDSAQSMAEGVGA